MAKKSAIEKNKTRILKVEAKKETRDALRKELRNRTLSLEDRLRLVHKLAKIPRASSFTRIRNRCEVTGRPRGFYRKFCMSRIALRELGSAGLIPGLTKSSW